VTDFKRMLNDILAVDRSAPAIEYSRIWRSWGDLADEKSAIDAALRANGLPEHAAIGVVLRNHPSSVAAMLSVMFGDRCLVALNPMLPPEKLREEIAQLKVPALIAERDDWTKLGLGSVTREIGAVGIELTGGPEMPVRIVPGLERIGSGEHHPVAPGVAIDMQTSGTTGSPKRVPLKYESFVAALSAAMAYEKDRKPGDPAKLRGGVVISHTSPVHTLGLWGIFTAILGGRRLCLLDKFNVPEWLDAVQRHHTKVALVPPAGLRMILDSNPTREQLGSLVALRSGTAPLHPEIIDQFLERFNLPVLENYGATEFAGGVAGWTIEDFRQNWHAKRGAVGRLNADVEARIVDPSDFSVAPFGTEGILELRARQFANGNEWVRTNDQAVLDADRFLWIKRRADNAIIRGGFKIHPDDIVSALERHPAIREACVVAMPDRRLGQVPMAALTLKSGATAPSSEDLSAFLRGSLTAYEIPVAYKLLAELPRTPSMKVSQPALMELFASDLSG
jgi:long-chain acyl-CoA synthetase